MQISTLFQIRNRYLRSIHLERDFHDPSILDSYVLTPQNKEFLERISVGLTPNSKQRAWRITGDFGSGKSSFALVLAHLFAGNNKSIPLKLRVVGQDKETQKSPKYLPVLVTGSREPLSVALLRSIKNAVAEALPKRKRPIIIKKIEKAIHAHSPEALSDDAALNLILQASEYINSLDSCKGLLIILDELGKFLEFAALHPDRQDVYFLQQLAEAASRSNQKPLFVIGLLHQGFNAYADQLTQSAQKEWEKVAGRFEELLFNQPLEQTAGLVADAFNVDTNKLPREHALQAEKDMQSVYELGWYGAASTVSALQKYSSKIFPIHPTVLPILVSVFNRFGQNERSLFSFLFSNEPFGIQEFSSKDIGEECFYRLHNLYDYVRANFGHRLSVQSYRSHWNQIDSVINSLHTTNKTEIQVLKTVGLLNLLDANNLLASDEAILLAVSGSGTKQSDSIKKVVRRLQKDKHILYHRGAAGGYCLWPYTSVNLEKVYEDASRSINITPYISELIVKHLETRPLVARRHYIQTGNLRHFEVRYTPISSLDQSKDIILDGSDGLVFVLLCENEEEHLKALEFARDNQFESKEEILIAVPKPLGSLTGLVHEAQRWQWISENTPELHNDTYAAEEVSRQIAASRKVLEKGIQNFIGFNQFSGEIDIMWFHQTAHYKLKKNRDLLAFLSDICDEVYKCAPLISNELVNRTNISSAAASGRMRLIEHIFNEPSKPFLGMDPVKKPPEMSMYLSILKNGGLHQEEDSCYKISLPRAESDTCNILPALNRIHEVLIKQPDKRSQVSKIFSELRGKPFGVRDGVLPLILAIYAQIYEQNLAFYENGSFLRHISGEDFPRLIKDPSSFDIQYCSIEGIRFELFNKLLKVLNVKNATDNKIELLDIVRPLCIFAAQLPGYTHKTKNLSSEAIAVRKALLLAREPAPLLFTDLPRACGYEPFQSYTPDASSESVEAYINNLKSYLDELKFAYPQLLERIKTNIIDCFDRPGDFKKLRKSLADASERILISVKEPSLKAFCIRLKDLNLSDAVWLESVGSLVCSKPPSKWTDSDEGLYVKNLEQLVQKFKRIESIIFDSKKHSSEDSAVRVSITKSDGAEIDEIVYLAKKEKVEAVVLEKKILKLLKQNKRVGLTAATQAVWKLLNKEANQ